MIVLVKHRSMKYQKQWRIQGEGLGDPDPPNRPHAYNFEIEILASTGLSITFWLIFLMNLSKQ